MVNGDEWLVDYECMEEDIMWNGEDFGNETHDDSPINEEDTSCPNIDQVVVTVENQTKDQEQRLDQHGPAIKMFGDTEHIIEPVTMPCAANNKRADTTGGTVHLDLGVACETVMTREVGASTNI